MPVCTARFTGRLMSFVLNTAAPIVLTLIVPPSAVFRSVRADEDLPDARRRSDPTGDPWTFYRRAASTTIRPRPRRSK